MAVFEKATADGKDVWKDRTGKVIDTTKVEDVLTKLSNVRTGTFEDSADPALKTPVLVVNARFGENKGEDLSETVTFARSGQSVVASRPDEPGSFKIDGTPLDDILKALDALK
jgi:hypothetical protein